MVEMTWRDKKRVSKEMSRQRLSRPDLEDNGGIHFDMPNGTAKAWNGKPFADVTDEELAAIGIVPDA